ncbi:MAG: hypothetical protein U0132_20590 [Gemmatimonadaceae bacterium]
MSYHFPHNARTTGHLVPVVAAPRSTRWPVQHAPVQTPGSLDVRTLAIDAVNSVLDALDAAGDYVRRVAL